MQADKNDFATTLHLNVKQFESRSAFYEVVGKSI